MADAIIPSIIVRVLPALDHLLGNIHQYSDNIAESEDSDLAAMLLVNGVLYAIWAPHNAPESRIVQPAELTVWLDIYPEDFDGETVKLLDIQLDDQGEIKRAVLSDALLELVLRNIIGNIRQ
jgi:hypothetical protein